jgi:hypothetical protein
MRDVFDLSIGGLLRNFSDRDAPYILVVSNTDPKDLVGMFSRQSLRADWQLNVAGSGCAYSFAELERRLFDKQAH